MEKYILAEMEILEFDVEDVIATSDETENIPFSNLGDPNYSPSYSNE